MKIKTIICALLACAMAFGAAGCARYGTGTGNYTGGAAPYYDGYTYPDGDGVTGGTVVR